MASLAVAALAVVTVAAALLGRGLCPPPAERASAAAADAGAPRDGSRRAPPGPGPLRSRPGGDEAPPERPGRPDAGPVPAGPSARPAPCEHDEDCVLSINYNYCCPCVAAALVEIVERHRCIFAADEAPERPEGCGLGCTPDACEPCPAQGTGAGCVEGECVTRYPGECRPGEEGCGAGRVCVLRDGEARCVEDPNECRVDDDCPRAGWECRDWDTAGVRACWHPDSRCRRHTDCIYHHFCEDPEGDGVFECVGGGEDCRPEYGSVECPAGTSCADPDGDGRGSCVGG